MGLSATDRLCRLVRHSALLRVLHSCSPPFIEVFWATRTATISWAGHGTSVACYLEKGILSGSTSAEDLSVRDAIGVFRVRVLAPRLPLMSLSHGDARYLIGRG